MRAVRSLARSAGVGSTAALRAPAPAIDRAPGLPRGRLIELSGDAAGARRTVAVQVALAAQREGDPIAWIQAEGGGLYPPDVAAAGVDLEAMLVVHVPSDAGVVGLPKAAELTLRTGAFGAVIVDVEGVRLPRGAAWLSRLSALAREHDTRCVFLAPPCARSLGPMVAVRLCPRRRQTRPGRYRLEAEVLRDKSGWLSGADRALPGPKSWVGPAGMP
ncbi:MAG: recombinase A [Sandaracinaceae bacterium]